MDKIFNILQQHRLEPYYDKFRTFGVKDERDFVEDITGEDLVNMGKDQAVIFRRKGGQPNIRERPI